MSTYGSNITCASINGIPVGNFQDAQNLESVLTTGNDANLNDINQVQTLRCVDVEVLAKVDTVKMETEILEVEDASANTVMEASYNQANSESDLYLYSLPTTAPSGVGASVPFKVWSNSGLLQIGDAIPTSDPLVAGRIWNNSGVLNVSTGGGAPGV